MNSSPAVLIPADEAGSTASTLLDTAERLFAAKGIENVSIRQIVMASGHGNLSGAHYHFGTREVLIRKLLERRMSVVDALRHQALDELAAQGRDTDLRAVIDSTVHVIETVVRNYSWGGDYVLVIAQALFNPRIHLLATIDAKAISGLGRTAALVGRVLPHLSGELVAERMRLVRHNAAYEFARWLQENGGLTDANQPSFDAMMRNLCDFVTAGLEAPVSLGTGAQRPESQPTGAALKRPGKKTP